MNLCQQNGTYAEKTDLPKAMLEKAHRHTLLAVDGFVQVLMIEKGEGVTSGTLCKQIKAKKTPPT